MASSRLHHSLSWQKKAIFAAIPSIILAIPVICFWGFFTPKRGFELIRFAWERTYTDRHIAIPAIGPRDGGFRGERVSPKTRHSATVWCEPAVDVPGILEIDANGRQYYRPDREPTFSVLIIGGSVATGVYATTNATTYFGQLGKRLESEGCPTSITVFASGAWKSVQELAAFDEAVRSGLKPDLVVFINGLNDLTNGATTEAMFGQVVPTRDGSRWTALYHEHDYARRTAVYLKNMRTAIAFARQHELTLLIVLQPALFERDPLTNVERQLLKDSLAPHKSKKALTDSYEGMRSGLGQLADEQRVFFLDCSRLFNGDPATTFTDMWHFSDFGHRMLADSMASCIKRILQESTKEVSVHSSNLPTAVP